MSKFHINKQGVGAIRDEHSRILSIASTNGEFELILIAIGKKATGKTVVLDAIEKMIEGFDPTPVALPSSGPDALGKTPNPPTLLPTS